LQAEWKSQEPCAPDLWWFLCIVLPCYFNWPRVTLGTWKWCFSVDTSYRFMKMWHLHHHRMWFHLFHYVRKKYYFSYTTTLSSGIVQQFKKVIQNVLHMGEGGKCRNYNI
jgi:hypothetical protein